MRVLNFYKDLIILGLTKKILLVTIFLYFLSVFFEAISIFLLIPIISLFLSGKELDSLIGSQEITVSISNFIQNFGISPDKYTILIILIFAILIRQIVVFGRSCWNVYIIQKLIHSLRQKAFSKFLHVRDDYFQNVSSGQTINDLTKETDNASQAMVLSLEALGLFCIFLVYVAIMFYLSVLFTIFALVSFLIAIIFLKKTLKASSEVGKSITKNNRVFLTHITQRFSNLRLIKLNGDELQELSKTINIIDIQKFKNIKSGVLAATINACIEPIILISGFLLLFGAIFLFDQNLINLGVFSIILIRGVPMVKNIFISLQKLEVTWPSLKAVIETFKNLEKEKEDESGNMLLSNKKAPSIEYKNVSYKYPNQKKLALQSISFKIKAGSITAIIGPSGAGKSTTIDFIPRLKIAQKGNVLIDGMNIKNINLSSLRNKIAYLSQTPQIIDGTIKEHISFGNNSLSEEEVLFYLKKVNCLELVKKLKYGIHTNIGTHGSKVSGGERQRLDLARVLAKEAPILILDEPSSNLDVLTEKTIQNIIIEEKKKKNKTIIIIGHKLNWFKNFDNIVIMKNGKIDSVGIHKDLKVKNEWYKSALKSTD